MKKILILSANPINTNQLRLDKEVREIQLALERSRSREQFELISRGAVRIDDLRRALLDNEPQVVHFSGHGIGTDGIVLENIAGEAQLVSTESLSNLFELFKDKVECVLLNACYSEIQAQTIHHHIDCVIGMERAVTDKAAINFSTGFYDALGAGRTYAESFEFGRNNIDLHGIPESLTPKIKIRNNSKTLFSIKHSEHHLSNIDEGNRNFIFNFIHPSSNEAPAKHSRIRQALLKQVNDEVEIRINSSLHNRVYIVLDVEQNPEQIELPWSSEIKVGLRPKIRLDNTDIINVFDQPDVVGRLLILGQPGSGKTTMLLKLAEELVKRAKDNSIHPVPVIFSLSSWKNDNQNIKDWLVDQLKDKYGVRKDIGKLWINNQEIIPLLDGLDELVAERQEKCVLKINEFLHPSNWTNPVIVCSRIQEYQRYTRLLQLHSSLELYPFSQQQVYQYLQSTDNLQLWDSISHDDDLSQLVQTPLILNIIVLSAQEISIQIWQQFQSSEERLSYLFDTYILRMLNRPYKDKKQPKQENTQCWLGWLAQRLIEENATEFLIEKMQPYWLKNQNKKLIYNLVIWQVMGGLTFGLTFSVGGLMFGLDFAGKSSIIIGLSSGLIIGLIGGLIVGLIKYKNETVKISKPSFKKSLNLLIIGLINGLIILAIFVGLGVGGLMLGLISENQIRQIRAVILMVVVWFPIGILQSLLGVALMFVAPIIVAMICLNKLFPNLYLNLLKLADPDVRMEILKSSYEQAMKEVNSEMRGERIKTLVKVMKVTPDEHKKVLRSIEEQTKRVNSEVSGDEIKTVEQLKFSWKKFKRVFSRSALFLLIAPIFLMIIFAFVLHIDWNNTLGIMKVYANNFYLMVVFGVLYGISAAEIEKKDIPNQGIRISVVNIVTFSIITAPLATIYLFLTYLNLSFNKSLILAFNKSLILGLLFGICYGIARSGTPAIKHFILRIILWSSGSIPWNYAKFLNYSTDRLFLQRVGGSYRFMHDLLRQHFAKSYTQITLAPVPEILLQPSPPQVQNHLVCTNCSQNNPANLNFCTKCGTKLNQPHI